MSKTSNTTAKALKALHSPSSPIIFANIWDTSSLKALLSLNSGSSKPVKAVATASWAIADAIGVRDEDLTKEQNIEAIRSIAPACASAGLPLSVDIQDGYGDAIGSVVAAVVEAGAVGANIEDSIPSAGFGAGVGGSLYAVDDQVQRLRSALKAASDAGCPDFVINARCDVFKLDASPDLSDEFRMKEAVSRGRAYLDAGATTVFLLGGQRGITRAELETFIREMDGRVAVILTDYPSDMTTSELANIGVARISVGPRLYSVTMNAFKRAAQEILGGGGLAS